MNGRVYDPSIGRFLSADKQVPYITHTQSFNRYSYVQNNPLSRVDPSGYGDIGSYDANTEKKKKQPPPCPAGTVRNRNGDCVEPPECDEQCEEDNRKEKQKARADYRKAQRFCSRDASSDACKNNTEGFVSATTEVLNEKQSPTDVLIYDPVTNTSFYVPRGIAAKVAMEVQRAGKRSISTRPATKKDVATGLGVIGLAATGVGFVVESTALAFAGLSAGIGALFLDPSEEGALSLAAGVVTKGTGKLLGESVEQALDGFIFIIDAGEAAKRANYVEIDPQE